MNRSEFTVSNGQPPTYDSIFGELKGTKESSTGIFDYAKKSTNIYSKKAASGCGLAVTITFVILFGLGVPIADIVIGSIYLKQCPENYLIPIYLIVSGVFGLTTGSLSSSLRKLKGRREHEAEQEDEQGKAGKGADGGKGITSLFLFCWFICGNVWIFGMKKCSEAADDSNYNATDCFVTNAEYSAANNYCHGVLYDFAFIENIVRLSVMGLGALAVITSCCCCCFVYCCCKKSEEQS